MSDREIFTFLGLYERYRWDDLAEVDGVRGNPPSAEFIEAWLITLILAQMRCHLFRHAPEHLRRIVRKAHKVVFGKLKVQEYLYVMTDTPSEWNAMCELYVTLRQRLLEDPQMQVVGEILWDVANAVAAAQAARQGVLFLSAVNALLGLEGLRSCSLLLGVGKRQWKECADIFD